MATSLQPQTLLRVGDLVVAKMKLQYGLESPGRLYTIEPGTRGKVIELQPGDIAVIGFECHGVGFKLWNEPRTVSAAVEILVNPSARAEDTPASHLRNALQILQGMLQPARITSLDEDIRAAESRVTFALELIERPAPDPAILEAYREMEKTNRELAARGDQLAVEEALDR